jgi:hypothetical protein
LTETESKQPTCSHCGGALDRRAEGQAAAIIAAPATAPPLPAQPADSLPPEPDVRRPTATTSGVAVASSVLGVLSLILVCWVPLLSVLAGVSALLLGIIGLRVVAASRGRKKGVGHAIAGTVIGSLSILVTILVVVPATYKIREVTERLESSNNLKFIALGMLNYHWRYKAFPPAARCDAAGNPLLSWRVLILPELGEGDLFNQFKLDEPWDGPNNSKLLARMPKFYALPGDPEAPAGNTHYRICVGNGAAFDKPVPNPRRVTRFHFTDGESKTILMVEAREGVPWTKPAEFEFDPKAPLPPLGGRFPEGFHVAMADGSVRWVDKNVSEQSLRAAITRAGGGAPGPDW